MLILTDFLGSLMEGSSNKAEAVAMLLRCRELLKVGAYGFSCGGQFHGLPQLAIIHGVV